MFGAKKTFLLYKVFFSFDDLFLQSKTEHELPSKGCIWQYNLWLLINYENKNVRLVWKNIQYKFY